MAQEKNDREAKAYRWDTTEMLREWEALSPEERKALTLRIWGAESIHTGETTGSLDFDCHASDDESDSDGDEVGERTHSTDDQHQGQHLDHLQGQRLDRQQEQQSESAEQASSKQKAQEPASSTAEQL